MYMGYISNSKLGGSMVICTFKVHKYDSLSCQKGYISTLPKTVCEVFLSQNRTSTEYHQTLVLPV